MALVLDPTVGGASANVYAALAAADAYHESHLYDTTWADASDDRKKRALLMATRLLDTWYDWDGEVVGSTQALLWPRIGVSRPGRMVWTGQQWPWSNIHAGLWEATDAIPTRIQQAMFEWARALLAEDRTADSDVETQGIRSLRAGPVELTFAASVAAKPVPDAVAALVSPYGRLRSRSGGAVTLYRA